MLEYAKRFRVVFTVLILGGALLLALSVWSGIVQRRNREMDARTDAALAIGRAWRARHAAVRDSLLADSVRIAALRRSANRSAQSALSASLSADSARVSLRMAETTADSLTAALAAATADSSQAAQWHAAFLDQVSATALLMRDLSQTKALLTQAEVSIRSLDAALQKEQQARHGRCLLGLCLSPTETFLIGAAVGTAATVTTFLALPKQQL